MLDGNVKTFPGIFPASMKAGEDKFLRVWYLARYLDDNRGFRVRRDEFVADIINTLNFSALYAHKLIEDGDGTWWRIDKKNGWLYLSGIKRICEHLEVEYSDDLPIAMPITALQSLGKFRAFSYAAYMQRYVKGNRSLPVSRQHLMELLGVTVTTLRRWEKKTGVIIHENMAFARPDDLRDTPHIHIEYHCACGMAFNAFEKFIAHRDGKGIDGVTSASKPCQEKSYFVVWQLPNSYEPPAMTTCGTASPICKTRMVAYRRRRAIPAATKCQSQGPAAYDAEQQRANQHTKSAAFRYRPIRKSDPVPSALMRRDASTNNIYRAFIVL